MRIECTLIRKNGTAVDIDGEAYHFKPSGKDSRHICDVKNRHHIARLLAIPEAYQIADDENEDEAAEIAAPVAEEALPLGGNELEADDSSGGIHFKNPDPLPVDAPAQKTPVKKAAVKSTPRKKRGKGKGKSK